MPKTDGLPDPSLRPYRPEFDVNHVAGGPHRVLPQEWTVLICPACNGQVTSAGCTHTGDCPNLHRVFVMQHVDVVPAPRAEQRTEDRDA